MKYKLKLNDLTKYRKLKVKVKNRIEIEVDYMYKKFYKALNMYKNNFEITKKKWKRYKILSENKKKLYKNFSFMRPLSLYWLNLKEWNKLSVLVRKRIINDINMYKFILFVCNYFLYKKKKRFGFLSRLKNFKFLNYKIKKYLWKRNLILNQIKFEKLKLRKFLRKKWFRLIYYKKFNKKQTVNYNKLYLLKYMEKKKRKRKKERLKLKRKTCLMIFKKTDNNFFIILSSLKGRVIDYKWVGQFNEARNIKNKRSYYLVFPMAKYIVDVLKKFRFYYLIIKVKSNITTHMHKSLQIIQENGIKIRKIYFRKPIPHHLGKRKKKMRRI